MLEAGTERHRAGKFAEARRLYGEVLARAPAHTVALFRSGLLELQDGHPETALLLVERATAADAGEPGDSTNANTTRIQRHDLVSNWLKAWDVMMVSVGKALAM